MAGHRRHDACCRVRGRQLRNVGQGDHALRDPLAFENTASPGELARADGTDEGAVHLDCRHTVGAGALGDCDKGFGPLGMVDDRSGEVADNATCEESGNRIVPFRPLAARSDQHRGKDAGDRQRGIAEEPCKEREADEQRDAQRLRQARGTADPGFGGGSARIHGGEDQRPAREARGREQHTANQREVCDDRQPGEGVGVRRRRRGRAHERGCDSGRGRDDGPCRHGRQPPPRTDPGVEECAGARPQQDDRLGAAGDAEHRSPSDADQGNAEADDV